MMIEDAKTCNKDKYGMYADFEGAFNAADHRIMLQQLRQLGMPSTFVDTCEQVYGVATTDYINPYGPTPSIDNNRGTQRGDTLSPFLFTLLLEPFLRWLTVGSRGYRPGTPTTNTDPTNPTATYPGHGFADYLSLATGSPSNMTIQLQKLSIFRMNTSVIVNVRKCCITGALWRRSNALSLANRTLLASHLQNHFVIIKAHYSPIPSISPSDSYRVLGVKFNTALTFTEHWQELKRTTTSLINALSTSLLTQSISIRVIRGLLIGKHFTLQLDLFNDIQLDILEGHQICHALRSAVS
jgi:hypothetical protein